LSVFITICPIGSVDRDVLDRIVACFQETCGVGCRISAKIEEPQYAYDERRGQYNAKLIIKDLIKRRPPDTRKFMGITHVDLFVPILKYIFGIAQMEGPCAVISLHRLRPQFYEESPNSQLFLERVEKTALHELGHSLGLTHCRDRGCVMHSSSRIRDTDNKKSRFCPTCSDLFKWYLEDV